MPDPDDDETPAPERWHLAPGDTLAGHREVWDDRDNCVAVVLAVEPGDEDATRRGRLIAAAPTMSEYVAKRAAAGDAEAATILEGINGSR